MKKIIYNSLVLSHNICTIFILFGPYIISTKYIKYWIGFIIFTFLQWWFLKACLLTLLEQKIYPNKPSTTNNFIKFLDKIGQKHNKDYFIFLLDILIFIGLIYSFNQLEYNEKGYIFITLVLVINYIKFNKFTFDFEGQIK